MYLLLGFAYSQIKWHIPPPHYNLLIEKARKFTFFKHSLWDSLETTSSDGKVLENSIWSNSYQDERGLLKHF